VIPIPRVILLPRCVPETLREPSPSTMAQDGICLLPGPHLIVGRSRRRGYMSQADFTGGTSENAVSGRLAAQGAIGRRNQNSCDWGGLRRGFKLRRLRFVNGASP
jgi:hypothetical protein